MYSKFEIEKFTMELDEEKNNLITVRIRKDENEIIVSFAVVYTHQTQTGKKTIFLADGSVKERVHIHQFYMNPPRKAYHNRPISFETIEHYVGYVQQKWRWILAQYKENYI